MGFDFSDKGYAQQGGYSSFEDNSVTDAAKLDTFRRWLHFEGDSNYFESLNKEDILYYCDKIFPELTCRDIIKKTSGIIIILLINGKSGLLVPPRDHGTLAKAIIIF